MSSKVELSQTLLEKVLELSRARGPFGLSLSPAQREMPADTSAVSLAFQRWLEDNKVRLGAIELSLVVEGGGDVNADGGGGNNSNDRPRRRRTILSTSASAPGSLIARVPDSAVLTVSRSSAAESLEAAGLGNRAGREEGETSSSWKEAAGLALALLVESRLGRASRFAPYVRWLLREGESDEEEQRTNHPATWDPKAANTLFGGTAVSRRLLLLPSSSSSSSPGGGLHAPSAVPLAWSRIALPWLSRNGMAAKKMDSSSPSPSPSPSSPSPSPSSLLSPSPPSSLKAEFLECLAVVSSYAFVLGEHQILALVPVFDALDHAPGPPRVRLSHSCGAAETGGNGDGGDGDGGGDGEEKGFLEMRSTVPLARGEEVFNSYGRLGTSALARRYSFAVSDREEMLQSGDERLEVSATEVGVAAAAAAPAAASSSSSCSSSSSSSFPSSTPLRAPAACLRAAAASRGKALSVAVPGGEPSPGLLLAVRAALPPLKTSESGERRKRRGERRRGEEKEREEEKGGSEGRKYFLEGLTLLEVARRRRAALEAAGRRAARALVKLEKRKEKGGGGSGRDGIIFPPLPGFRLADAVRRNELEGCDSLESWVRRRML